ncbi:MAG: flagella basal body P-ring formation protein FlgA [Rhodospirillaceae bacterium]|nr:flagella basal body P-ring formation protein FlgA [Rhodospirillaceae bacterium]
MSGRMASCGMGAVALLAAVQALPAGAAPVASARFENLDRIDSLVAMTVGAGIGQTGGAVAPVDRRLRLQACPQLPEVTGPVFGAAMVQCKALGWRIRVPLRLETSAAATPGLAARARYDRPAAAAPKTILIRKGDPVQLVAGGASFTVSRMMVADEDGAVGDMIRVREDRKSAPVLAQVTENGIVRVPGFKEY